ncbi:MAG: hypothetical protein SPI62_02810 [Candidatus Enteromonas sp.]|nr:hypothetical protein [bacterium]MDY6100781.1 hypothetical protein [Candidatus Enteromonas sp.]
MKEAENSFELSIFERVFQGDEIRKVIKNRSITAVLPKPFAFRNRSNDYLPFFEARPLIIYKQTGFA